MSHSAPDWGLGSGSYVTHQVLDLGELAARLGAIDTFDRRGDLLWMDDFEDNINKWYTEVQGNGASVALSTDTARTGAKSCKLTTGDTALDYALVKRYIPLPVVGRLSAEVSFTVDIHMKYMEFLLYVYTGTRVIATEMRYRYTEKDLRYRDSAYDLQVLDGAVGLFPSTYMFHTLKWAVDTDTEMYIRALLDSNVYDMSAIPLSAADSAVEPMLYFLVRAVTNRDFNDACYLDDVIFKQNEP